METPKTTPPPGEGWDKVGTTGVADAVRAALKRPPSRPEDQDWYRRVVAVKEIGLPAVLLLMLVSFGTTFTWALVFHLPSKLTEANRPMVETVAAGFATLVVAQDRAEVAVGQMQGELATFRGIVAGRSRCPEPRPCPPATSCPPCPEVPAPAGYRERHR